MYLHYGRISPVHVALAARESGAPDHQIDAFLEELIVRRELAFNYVWFEPEYDRYAALPAWARRILEGHRDDPGEHAYTRGELGNGKTHDRYWNAATAEMRDTGYLRHQHARVRVPHALELNNRYLLDGRDPNCCANVARVFGLHDRPWQERSVFGTFC